MLISTYRTSSFEPFTLTIRVESQEELNALRLITGYPVSISDLVANGTNIEQWNAVHDFLGALQEKVM